MQLADAQDQTGAAQQEEEKSPAEKMRSRFPQPVLVADLLGMRVLGNDLRVLGHVRAVANTADGIKVVIVSGDLLGLGGREVALPIEALGLLGDQMLLLDLPPDYPRNAPTYYASQATELAAQSMILVALTSR